MIPRSGYRAADMLDDVAVPLPGENPSAEVRMAAIVHGYELDDDPCRLSAEGSSTARRSHQIRVEIPPRKDSRRVPRRIHPEVHEAAGLCCVGFGSIVGSDHVGRFVVARDRADCTAPGTAPPARRSLNIVITISSESPAGRVLHSATPFSERPRNGVASKARKTVVIAGEFPMHRGGSLREPDDRLRDLGHARTRSATTRC